MSMLNLSDAKKTIFSQEDIPLPIKRSAWSLFLHELERPRGRKGISPRKVLDSVIGWMIVQKKKQDREAFKPNPMQKKILYLIAIEGYTQGQAALELDRSPETLKQYCASLKKQLGVDSFSQVVAIAVEQGWISPPSVNGLPKKV